MASCRIDRRHIKILFAADDLVHALDKDRFFVVTKDNLGPFEPPRPCIPALEATPCA
jgi:hypothetical protein